MTAERPLVVWLGDLDRGRVAEVGGKNASLGEMLRHLAGAGIHVPDGFATTAAAYWRFVDANDLRERIAGTLEDLKRGRLPLARAGRALRRLFTDGAIPPELADAVAAAYRTLGERIGRRDPDVAVRSSATA